MNKIELEALKATADAGDIVAQFKLGEMYGSDDYYLSDDSKDAMRLYLRATKPDEPGPVTNNSNADRDAIIIIGIFVTLGILLGGWLYVASIPELKTVATVTAIPAVIIYYVLGIAICILCCEVMSRIWDAIVTVFDSKGEV